MLVRRLLPPPAVGQLKGISPSLAAQLRRCALSAAFGHSPSHRQAIPRGPYLRLGDIAHYVITAVGRGALDGVDESAWDGGIAELWDQRADREADEVARSCSDVHLGHPGTWRYAEERFAATLFECRSLAASGFSSASSLVDRSMCSGCRVEYDDTASEIAGTEPTLPLFDVRLEALGGQLHGRPDHIGLLNGELVVIDYKSGSVLDSADDSHSEMKIRDEYRWQLLLYAVLCHESLRQWPTKLILKPIGGSSVAIDVTPSVQSEAASALENAITMLDRYNAAVGENAWVLATPGPRQCEMCAFRGLCDPFWRAAQADWPPIERPALAGTVLDMVSLQNQRTLVTLHVTAGTLPRTDTKIRGFEGGTSSNPSIGLELGENVRIVSVRRGDEMSVSDSTEIWVGDPSTLSAAVSQ